METLPDSERSGRTSHSCVCNSGSWVHACCTTACVFFPRDFQLARNRFCFVCGNCLTSRKFALAIASIRINHSIHICSPPACRLLDGSRQAASEWLDCSSFAMIRKETFMRWCIFRSFCSFFIFFRGFKMFSVVSAEKWTLEIVCSSTSIVKLHIRPARTTIPPVTGQYVDFVLPPLVQAWDYRSTDTPTLAHILPILPRLFFNMGFNHFLKRALSSDLHYTYEMCLENFHIEEILELDFFILLFPFFFAA